MMLSEKLIQKYLYCDCFQHKYWWDQLDGMLSIIYYLIVLLRVLTCHSLDARRWKIKLRRVTRAVGRNSFLFRLNWSRTVRTLTSQITSLLRFFYISGIKFLLSLDFCQFWSTVWPQAKEFTVGIGFYLSKLQLSIFDWS